MPIIVDLISYEISILKLNGFLSSFSARDILAALGRLPGAPQSVEGVAIILIRKASCSFSYCFPVPFFFFIGKKTTTTTTKTRPHCTQYRRAQSTRIAQPTRVTERRANRCICRLMDFDGIAFLLSRH
jgi:hypothetical protein